MRKLLRDSFKAVEGARSTAVRPNVEKVQKWIHTLTDRANSSEAKNFSGQLSSLFNFYSKPASTTKLPEINWNYYKENIKTVGLVDKVEKGYTELMKEEYDVERICNQVVSSQSKELEDLENELTFHSCLWAQYYAEQTMFLFELEDYGDPNSYLMHEHFDFFPGLEADVEELIETHNWLPGSKDDINLHGYMAVQFNWGKKVISFYRHPADDFKSGRCTKNILGR